MHKNFISNQVFQCNTEHYFLSKNSKKSQVWACLIIISISVLDIGTKTAKKPTIYDLLFLTAIYFPKNSKQDQLYRNKSSHLKQLLFSEWFFFRILSCLKQLLLSNNFFLVTNTVSEQLLLQDKYFLSTATVWKELNFQNKWSLRTCTFLK